MPTLALITSEIDSAWSLVADSWLDVRCVVTGGGLSVRYPVGAPGGAQGPRKGLRSLPIGSQALPRLGPKGPHIAHFGYLRIPTHPPTPLRVGTLQGRSVSQPA